MNYKLIDLLGQTNPTTTKSLIFRLRWSAIYIGIAVVAIRYFAIIGPSLGAYVVLTITILAAQYSQTKTIARDTGFIDRPDSSLVAQVNVYKTLLEEAIIGILVIGLDGKILYNNISAEEIFGYQKGELLDLYVENLVPDNLRSGHQNNRASYHKNPAPRLMGEGRDLTGLRKDGAQFPIEVGLSHIKSSDQHYITAFVHNISKRKKAEDLVKTSLEEKEVLLREVHHRVKNNLQSLVSLINLQILAEKSPEAIHPLEELQGRIHAISLVHEKLYNTETLDKIDINQYIEEIASNLIYSFGNSQTVKLSLNIEPHFADINVALPLGLIINELVTNSLKYAFPEEFNSDREILIKLEFSHKKYTLSISDNGKGLPSDFDWKNSPSLGLKLVNIWAEQQLRGELFHENVSGTKFIIKFEKPF